MRPGGTSDPATRRARSVDRLDLLLVGALIALVTAIYAIYALRVGSFQNDEELYLEIARYVAGHFPSALWQSGLYPRGTQRLDQIILALPFALLRRGPGAYELGHVIQCLLFASTALPVLLIARRVGLPRAASLFAATLSIVIPWAVVSTSFLTESLAYPVYAWTIYATWSTIREPSIGRDLLAILALVVAALSRTALLALAPILPLAIIWQEWSWELRGRPLPARARALPGRVWSTHPLVTVLVGLALLALLGNALGLLPGGGLASLAGEYGLPHIETFSTLLDRYREYLARMAVGTGFIALALALPWTVSVLVRPRDGMRHALAVVCTLGLAMILLSLLQAAPDERYVLYSAVPISLAAAAALSDWGRGDRASVRAVAGVLVGTVVVLALTASATWPELANPYDYFTYPAGMFYKRVLLGHLRVVDLPLLHISAAGLLELGIAVLVVAWALAGRVRGAARPAAWLLGAALIVLCAGQMLYAMKKFTATAGAASGPGAGARSWVDEHVPSGTRVGAVAVSLGESPAYVPIWRTTEFFNTSVGLDVYFAEPGLLPIPLGSEPRRMTIAPDSGLVTSYGGPALKTPTAAPEYLLVPQQGTNRIVLDGKIVATDSYLPLVLLRLSRPARAEWSIVGTNEEGFLESGVSATSSVYSAALAGLSRPCATFSLIAPEGFAGAWHYTVSSGTRKLRRGSLRTQQMVSIVVPLSPRATPRGPSATVSVTVRGQTTMLPGELVSAKLAFFGVEQCPAAAS